MNHLQKNYLEYVKTGRNGSKFTIGKYHINIMEIIKLFQVNNFMPVTKFPSLTIWLFCQKGPFQILGQFRGPFEKPAAKIGHFTLRRKGEKKHE